MAPPAPRASPAHPGRALPRGATRAIGGPSTAFRTTRFSLLDADGCVATWNTGAEIAKRYTAEEIIGRHISVFYTPEDVKAGRPESLLRRAIEEGASKTRAGGSARMEADSGPTSSSRQCSTTRRCSRFHQVCVTRDLTEKRLEHQALRLSEQRFSMLVQSVKDHAIFMLDSKGTWRPGTPGPSESRAIGVTKSSDSPCPASICPRTWRQGSGSGRSRLRNARKSSRGRLSASQGRQPFLGRRGHRAAPRRRGHFARLHQGHARLDRTPGRGRGAVEVVDNGDGPTRHRAPGGHRFGHGGLGAVRDPRLAHLGPGGCARLRRGLVPGRARASDAHRLGAGGARRRPGARGTRIGAAGVPATGGP